MPKRALVGGAGLFAASHHAVTTCSQAAISGLTPSHIRLLKSQHVLAEPRRGVLIFAGSPPTWEQRLAAATIGRAQVVGSHRSAGRLHNCDGFGGGDGNEAIDLTVRRGCRVLDRNATRYQLSQWLAPEDAIVISGIASTSLARTIVDLADICEPAVVERLIDDFERRGNSLGWLEATAHRAQRRSRPGAAIVLAEVAKRRTRRSRVRGSWFEKVIEECLRSPIIGVVSVQHELRDDDGDLIGYFDLAVPEVRLGIEGHSRSFHVGTARETIDERRDNRAALVGWDIRYLGYADATKTPQRIRRYIEQLVVRRRRDLGIGET